MSLHWLQLTKGPIHFDTDTHTQICPMQATAASRKAVTKNVLMETFLDVNVENQRYK